MRTILEYPPGDHDITATVVVPAGAIVRGQGAGVTTLHNLTPSAANDWLFFAPDGGVIFENLSVNNHGHRLALCAYGSGNLASGLEVFGHSSVYVNGEQLESFAVLFVAPAGQPATRNRIRDVLIHSFADGYNGGLGISGLGGQTLGEITQCTYLGSGIPGSGHDTEGTMGANVVAGCTFVNIAVGAYTEGDLATQVVRNCHFVNVRGAAARLNLETTQQRTFIFENNDIVLTGGTGVHVTAMQAHVDVLEVTGNRFSGAGRWLDVRDTHLVLRDNRYALGLTHMVERCTGEAQGNVSADGQWRTDVLRLGYAGRSQLRTKENEEFQPKTQK